MSVGDPMNTWDEFKRQLKKQFYPKDAENEARDKLRCLQHKKGHIWEYIKEFQELLLEIPSMGEQDELFASSMAYVGGPIWSLRGVVCNTFPPQSSPPRPQSSSRGSPPRDKIRRQVVVAKVGETRRSLIGATSHPQQETKGVERRMRH